VEAYFVGGAFMFSTSHFYKEIIPDPRINFFGEEHTTPLRAWTNGFRIFSIKENVVWHLGKTKEYFKGIGSGDWKENLNLTSLTLGNMGTYAHHYDNVLKGFEYGPLAAKDEESYIDYLKAMGFDYRTGEEFD